MSNAASTIRSFTPPADASEAPSLMTQELDVTTLKPNSRVLCVNRGRQTLTDTYDGVHVNIPPGYFETEYGAATHFQRRLIVPGTKHVETGAFQSWIGILGTPEGRVQVDDEGLCERFTDAQLQSFGEKIDAFDRGGNPDAMTLKAMRIATAPARGMLGGTGVARRGIDASQQATDVAAAAAESVLDKPGYTAAQEDAAAAAAEGVRRKR